MPFRSSENLSEQHAWESTACCSRGMVCVHLQPLMWARLRAHLAAHATRDTKGQTRVSRCFLNRSSFDIKAGATRLGWLCGPGGFTSAAGSIRASGALGAARERNLLRGRREAGLEPEGGGPGPLAPGAPGWGSAVQPSATTAAATRAAEAAAAWASAAAGDGLQTSFCLQPVSRARMLRVGTPDPDISFSCNCSESYRG